MLLGIGPRCYTVTHGSQEHVQRPLGRCGIEFDALDLFQSSCQAHSASRASRARASTAEKKHNSASALDEVHLVSVLGHDAQCSRISRRKKIVPKNSGKYLLPKPDP